VFIAVNNESLIEFSAVPILYRYVVIHRLQSMLNHCKNTGVLRSYSAPIDIDEDVLGVRFEYANSGDYSKWTITLG
jgi:hypothetical protein